MIKKKIEKLSEKDFLQISTEDGKVKNSNPLYNFFNEKKLNDTEVIDLESKNVKKNLNFLYPVSFIILIISLFILSEQLLVQKKENIVLKKESEILQKMNRDIIEDFEYHKLKMDKQKVTNDDRK